MNKFKSLDQAIAAGAIAKGSDSITYFKGVASHTIEILLPFDRNDPVSPMDIGDTLLINEQYPKNLYPTGSYPDSRWNNAIVSGVELIWVKSKATRWAIKLKRLAKIPISQYAGALLEINRVQLPLPLHIDS